jgi:hypothetical protein
LRFEKDYLLLAYGRMPCSCQVPVPQYPETAHWGPILWQILHGLAERAERCFQPVEEIREWQKFIKLTGEMLPCDLCRNHFKEYSQQYPLTQMSTLQKGQVKPWIKNWLWHLHNEINTGSGKPEFLYDDLESTYSNVDLTDQLYRLTPIVKKAIDLHGVPLFKWTTWVASFKMLRSIDCL